MHSPSRRHALATAGAWLVAGSGLLTPCSNAARSLETASRPLIKPPRLRRGDLVALVSPSGWISEELLERAYRNLESLGLRVKLGLHALARSGNYAGTLKERLADLHAAFRDPNVRAIWPARGGSGAAMLLPHLNWSLVRANPKIVIGYSDLTALLVGLYRHARLVAFHGPVASSQFLPETRAALEAVLFEGAPLVHVAVPEAQRERARTNPEDAPRTLGSGTAEGPLVGGNLSVIASLIGTPDAAPLAGHLLFLEDVGEAPYRLDRMLFQLQQSHGFERIRGLALGVFRRSSDPDAAQGPKHTLAQVLEERFAAIEVPAAYGLPFGHIAPQGVLPLGIRAQLDADRHTLTLLESAVN